MTHTFKLARRTARLRTPFLLTLAALAFGACNSDRLSPGDPNTVTDAPISAADPALADSAAAEARLADSLAAQDALADPSGGQPIADEDDGVGDVEDTDVQVEVVEDPAALSASSAEGLSMSAYRGGIPFGVFHLPTSLYGRGFSGSLANTSSATRALVPLLAAARRSGVKVVISLVGADHYYKNGNGTFSLAKWKSRVSKYRGVNISSYIKDGTIIGHYILDEPHDPSNWAGHTISRATVDEMARYSKSIWPSMPTIVRGWPAYLKGYHYRYLDAAWAQYSARFGNVSTWLQKNVRDAQSSHLALVVGLNQLAGGGKGGLPGFYRRGFYAMSGKQMRAWGATILGNSYPCAFLSWAYNSKYMNRSDIKSARAYLAGKAGSKANKSCRAR
ncbi:MAG TPA: hypothetical protein VGN76_07035 [Gemmatimonadales bacterium]|jgi:hypothetical protein|nr:hypothetical protein [Gemmatimonadales bacterium]